MALSKHNYRHKWTDEYPLSHLTQRCVKCGARHSKNFGRDTRYQIPWREGEPIEICDGRELARKPAG